jgi:hypothetical protein
MVRVTEFCVVVGHSELVLVLDELFEALRRSICTTPTLTDLETAYVVVEQGMVTVPLIVVTPLKAPLLLTVTVLLVELKIAQRQ